MKVSVVRGGGVAGIATRTELSASALPDKDARTFRELVRDAALKEHHGSSGRTGPDRTLYEVALDDGETVVRSRFSDDDIPDGVRRLVEWIDRRPERSRSRER